MSIPLSQMFTVAKYAFLNRVRGRHTAPLVLMLEPLFRCNLKCLGCGKIQYPEETLNRRLSVEECIQAVLECGAPMVSIPGGEPLLHPEIDRIVRELCDRRKYVYLCTNALLLEKKLSLFKPGKYLTFSVHLDGQEAEHDESVRCPGTYQRAVSAIRLAIEKGFRVTTNTTLYTGMDPLRIRGFFDEMMKLGIEGLMISPGYSYDSAPDQTRFLKRKETAEFFRRILFNPAPGWKFNQSPLFIEFLTGTRHFECTPYGNPTYNIFGWQRPCYLLAEGYAKTYRELIDQTRWENYGEKSGNPACIDCMVHSGHEPTAVGYTFGSFRGLLNTIRALINGPKVHRPADNIPGDSKTPRAHCCE